MAVPIVKGRVRVAVGKGVRVTVGEGDGVAVDAGDGVAVGESTRGVCVVAVPLHPANSKRNNPTLTND